jgi:hypothetical protein
MKVLQWLLHSCSEPLDTPVSSASILSYLSLRSDVSEGKVVPVLN